MALFMEPPSAKQINPHDDLDGQVACKHFLGKTVQEAEPLFRENPLYYQEDLMWMGPVAFRYYVQAAIRFLQDEADSGQPDFIGGFTGTLEFRLEHEPMELAPIAEQLASICGYIVDHYDRLGDLPKTEEKGLAIIESVRKQFAIIEQILGKEFVTHKPEDYIDLRPRLNALRHAFLELATRKS